MSKLKYALRFKDTKTLIKNIGMTILVLGLLKYSTNKLKTIKSESH